MKTPKRTTFLSILLTVVVAFCVWFWTRPEIREGNHSDGRYRYKVRKIDGVERAYGKIESWWHNGNRHLVAKCDNSLIPERFFMRWSRKPDFVLDGKYTEWHRNGQMAIIGEYGSGNKIGMWTHYHENGQKAITGKYDSGSKIGIWTYYHENGHKHSEGNYRNNKQHGAWVRWNPDGMVLGTNMFNHGTGTFVDWYPDGTKRIVCHYHDGNLHGETTQWYPDGRLQFHGRFVEGKRNGDFTGVGTNGTIWQIAYSNGVKISEITEISQQAPAGDVLKAAPEE